jgi:hypothetical protein
VLLLPVYTYQHGSHWTDILYIWYWGVKIWLNREKASGNSNENITFVVADNTKT